MLKCVPLKSALLRSFSHFQSPNPHNPNYSKYAFYSSCTRQKLHNTCACSFNNINNAVVTSHTRIYATDSSKKWKGRLTLDQRRKKKYAELLEVKEGMVTKQKIKVQNLSKCNFEKMAHDTLSLREFLASRSLKEEMPEHKSLSSVTTNLDMSRTDASNVISTLVQPKTDVDMNEKEILDELENESIPTTSTNVFSPETIHNEEISDNTKEVEVVDKGKDLNRQREIASKTLAAYFETCQFTRLLESPENFLWSHRYDVKKGRKKFPKLVDVQPYNAVLRVAAYKADMNTVKDIMQYIRDDGITLNVQSYVSIFDCISKVTSDEFRKELIQKYAEEALAQGITFNDIMNDGYFLFNQRENVLRIMKLFDPNYEITLREPSLQYNNKLVNKLNHEDQLSFKASKNTSKTGGLFTEDEMKMLVNEQLKLETTGQLTVENIERKALTNKKEVKRCNILLESHLHKWRKTATMCFRDLIKFHNNGFLKFTPFLLALPEEEYVELIIEEAKRIGLEMLNYSPTRYSLHKNLGQKVYDRYQILTLKRTQAMDKIIDIHQDYCTDYVKSHGQLDHLPSEVDNINCRQKWQHFENKRKLQGATVTIGHQPWVNSVIQKMGEMLYSIILRLEVDVNAVDNTKDSEDYRAFKEVCTSNGRKMKLEIRPHAKVAYFIQTAKPPTLTFNIDDIPMKCPPRPWTSPKQGGYLVHSCPFVRLPWMASHQMDLINKVEVSQNYPLMDSLNQLSSIPWKVNEKVLDIAIKIFNDGGSKKLDIPLVTERIPKPQVNKNNKLISEYNKAKKEMHSLRCECLYKLSLANHFRKDIIWFPHNMDFRGRIYPVPPHFNHLGSDLSRSILMFAEPRPLGPKGFDWLKIHLINLTGKLKRDSLSARLAYANEIMPEIIESASNPVKGNMWWMQSEEPWQTLACCIEIAAVHNSPDPEKYMSCYPIHQDGSCNGLQHYAALGRDVKGAHSVNLLPGDKPEDVYSVVVNLVEEKRQRDAKMGVEIAQVLEGFIKRKVIKQTIMTTVYGVTKYGARMQILKQLKDIEDFPESHVNNAATYLTSSTFESLKSMFSSTKLIQDWLTKCARHIASEKNELVEWVTPMGLHVVQPYCKHKLRQNCVYNPYVMDKYEKTDGIKQKNAFAPNFVHSLDSSHMMLTSIHSERAGITFVSVHDCFWTHASTVEIMNRICREQFVALHFEPILENLSKFFQEKYNYSTKQLTNDGSIGDIQRHKFNKTLSTVPKKGDLDLKEVLKSTYFFS